MTRHEHLVSTRAAEVPCGRCGSALLVAVDEGLRVRVDAAALVDQAAELVALIEGRATYTLISAGHLIHRDAHRIATRAHVGAIHAEHRCPPRPHQTTIFDLAKGQM